MDMKAKLTQVLKRKADSIPSKDIAFILDGYEFRVAGGCFMNGEAKDYDVYPAFGKSFDIERIRRRTVLLKSEVVCETKNAVTVKVNGKVIQFCKYYKPTLYELLDSFDFSHCQVGVEYGKNEDGIFTGPVVKEVGWTDAYMEYRITGQSTYTGSEYPLSSLIRLNKYVKRDVVKGRSYVVEAIKILTDIIERGYLDYDDFKDQLDAIDLMLLEANESNAAFKLFEACHSKSLVCKRYSKSEIDGLMERFEEAK